MWQKHSLASSNNLPLASMKWTPLHAPTCRRANVLGSEPPIAAAAEPRRQAIALESPPAKRVTPLLSSEGCLVAITDAHLAERFGHCGHHQTIIGVMLSSTWSLLLSFAFKFIVTAAFIYIVVASTLITPFSIAILWFIARAASLARYQPNQ
jgi:hypothetical protein